MAKTAYVSFRASELEGELQARDDEKSLGLAAKRDLERYYPLLRDELRTIDLGPDEAVMLCQALSGEKITGARYRTLLWASVLEMRYLWSLRPKEVEKSQNELAAKLRKLSPGQSMALIDAVERFWRLPNALDALDPTPGEEAEATRVLAQVGLVHERWIKEAEEAVQELGEQAVHQLKSKEAEEAVQELGEQAVQQLKSRVLNSPRRRRTK
jgi:hypothetical protein